MSGDYKSVSRVRARPRLLRILKSDWQLYVILSVPLIWLIIFCYVPMGGIVVAFQNYNIRRGIFRSDWVGLRYIKMFVNSPNFLQLIGNTLSLSVYSLLVGFPMPIILAIALNECRFASIKKTVQTLTYLPYFISTVVLISIMSQIFHLRFGVFNVLRNSLGMESVDIMGKASLFRHLYVWSGIWQGMGFEAVLYIAALTNISTEIKEAAIIDGANRFQCMINVDLPGILPTIIIMLILSVGNLMSVGFEKAYLMQNPGNLRQSELISTYIYKLGLEQAQYSFSTAVSLFNSATNFVLILTCNLIVRKLGGSGLW
ncbi:MAG: sugar ABC transporter permease [Clostridia bacterium]|nr:sugar ABC transporter permease [Clostridia bacterium]